MRALRFLGLAATLLAAFPAHAGETRITATVYHQWYNGRPDACGTTYLDSKVSAAHAYLPCGTRLLVRHGGRSLVVRVTDRCDCNSLDLSYKAAKLLGVPTDGVARVTINRI